MTVPVDRLIHFVDIRLAQLRMSKEEAARRGFPNPSTLAKIRDRVTQQTPRVRTLLRIDRTLGWEAGSAAVVLLGGLPLTVTARTTAAVRRRQSAARPLDADDVMVRTLDALGAEIACTAGESDKLSERTARLTEAYRRLREELTVDQSLVGGYSDEAGLRADSGY